MALDPSPTGTPSSSETPSPSSSATSSLTSDSPSATDSASSSGTSPEATPTPPAAASCGVESQPCIVTLQTFAPGSLDPVYVGLGLVLLLLAALLVAQLRRP